MENNLTNKDLFLAHKPVMLGEMLEYLAPKKGDKILDCTFGAGGYSKAILDSCECSVTALDRDPTVEPYVEQVSSVYRDRFKFIQTNFAEAKERLHGQSFNGIVLDLGVSSMQIDYGERGFSFTYDGPLDMRMSKEGTTAADFVNRVSEKEIANVIYKYGEEVASRKIAKNIVMERQVTPITTTSRLAKIVRSSIGYRSGKIDAATKTFQGIRIYINDELGELEKFLNDMCYILAPGGRVVIVSFHSLEDALVKNFLKMHSAKVVARSKYAKVVEENEPGKWLKILTKKALSPSQEEVKQNPRSRSAKLRVAIKIGGEYEN